MKNSTLKSMAVIILMSVLDNIRAKTISFLLKITNIYFSIMVIGVSPRFWDNPHFIIMPRPTHSVRIM